MKKKVLNHKFTLIGTNEERMLGFLNIKFQAWFSVRLVTEGLKKQEENGKEPTMLDCLKKQRLYLLAFTIVYSAAVFIYLYAKSKYPEKIGFSFDLFFYSFNGFVWGFLIWLLINAMMDYIEDLDDY